MTDVAAPRLVPRAAGAAAFAALLLLAFALAAGQLLAEYWPATAATLPDADDAMRLVEVRAFLSGQGWFDLHEPRLGGVLGYDTHWSRLVDAGLAGLYLAFRAVADAPLAERLMLAVWPVLWLLPCIASVAAIAWRLGGRDAAIMVLLLAIFAGAGVQQFRPGRIDHHNVQIALSLVAVAALAWADRKPYAAALAALASAVGLAIGFEGLPFFVFCGAALALWFVIDAEAAPALRRYALALAAGALVAFLVSVPPSRWGAAQCDAIAINSAAALAVTALALLACTRLAASARSTRLAGVGCAGALGLMTFAVLEPQCLSGHYAAIDPAIRAIWLSYVSETQPLHDLFARAPATALATIAFPLAAAIAAAYLLARRPSGFGAIAALAGFAVALLYMMTAVRGVSAAVWLGMPLVAAALIDLFARAGVTSLPVRFAAALALTPTALTVATISAASAVLQGGVLDLNAAERRPCVTRATYAPLAALAPGRVAVNEMEWAPYLLAWTPLDALAGPYHRLSGAILAQHEIFARPPQEARAIALRARVDYLFVCGSPMLTGLAGEREAQSLFETLRSGAVPDWLEAVPLAASARVYRVRP